MDPNYIDTGFFVGLLVGIGVMLLFNWAKKYEKEMDGKIEEEHYEDIEEIFRMNS